ncbi:hypothetical protein [Curtobacterium sp. MCBA15_004]|uniref:hypothetical protein n=1 Tax=Curtobacterium sp. MCBA15_004 TaxID=1898733 RepID=UPI0008DDB447|nr:hypothetical protein [Curtobacterium sp. MCBA15_004]WIA96413.1 hypothetical protein QOL16_15145 [Curtobacterium sp. MCBA15_004]WIA97624.1 hypothetical protein QOL16_04310 [Curtobacterium sp. MCBA15_004]
MADDDLFRLARNLGQVPGGTGPKLRQAIEITSRKIKDQIKSDYDGSRNLPHAGGSISYDIKGTGSNQYGGQLEAEIGPVLGGQGSVVGLVDEGTSKTPGKKRIPKALADNADDFELGIQRAIDDALGEAGL